MAEPRPRVRRLFLKDRVGESITCPKCGQPHTIDERQVKVNSLACRTCHAAALAKWKLENLEHRRVYSRIMHKQNKARPNRSKEYRQAFPERSAAHRAVHNAKKRGRLKQMPCEVCGDAKTHAHHEDYSKPLEVMWLCPIHHAERHESTANPK